MRGEGSLNCGMRIWSCVSVLVADWTDQTSHLGNLSSPLWDPHSCRLGCCIAVVQLVVFVG